MAPVPKFPDWTNLTQVTNPTTAEIGKFPLEISYAGWGLWDNSSDSSLQDWIKTSSWSGLETDEPDGWVFGGIVAFTKVIGT